MKTTTSFENLLSQYDYHLPPELIAQQPSQPRDAARLLVYNRKTRKINYDVFANLPKYLPKHAVIVFNQTKVVPARLPVIKPTGGKADILYIDHDKNYIKALSNRKLPIGERISIKSQNSPTTFTVIKKVDSFYFLKPNFPIGQIKSILEKYGKTPLPPYIKQSKLTEKQKRSSYQTIFAKAGLSVAAPTASLHFTKGLLHKLKEQGIEIRFITLNVNLGTFAPLREENLKTGRLHKETYEINKKIAADLNKFKKMGRPIIGVGTTVVRTLESAAITNGLKKLSGTTDLFIQPGFKLKFIDGLITNFHVPKSSLMMLVSSLTGREELLNIYNKAIKKKFRFFSFGDGMLIL